MHVDIDVEFARHLEHPIDLTVRVTVGIGRCADAARSIPQGRDHEFVGARIVQQTFLGKDADFDIDCPGKVGNGLFHTLNPAQADDGIDFHVGPHSCGAVHQAFAQGARCPFGHVLFTEILLQPGDFTNGLVEIAPARTAPIQYAGLVEVDVGLDEARHDQPAFLVEVAGARRKPLAYLHDPAVRHADVDRLCRVLGQHNIPQGEIHGVFPVQGRWPR